MCMLILIVLCTLEYNGRIVVPSWCKIVLCIPITVVLAAMIKDAYDWDLFNIRWALQKAKMKREEEHGGQDRPPDSDHQRGAAV